MNKFSYDGTFSIEDFTIHSKGCLVYYKYKFTNRLQWSNSKLYSSSPHLTNVGVITHGKRLAIFLKVVVIIDERLKKRHLVDLPSFNLILHFPYCEPQSLFLFIIQYYYSNFPQITMRPLSKKIQYFHI